MVGAGVQVGAGVGVGAGVAVGKGVGSPALPPHASTTAAAAATQATLASRLIAFGNIREPDRPAN